jgi:uncharacterized FlaG/YvyC family protein
MIVDPLQKATSSLDASGEERKAEQQHGEASAQPARQPAREDKGGPHPAPLVVPSEVNLAYHVDAKTDRIYFQVVDSRSGEVIRQVPSKEALALDSQITQFLKVEQNDAKHPAGK